MAFAKLVVSIIIFNAACVLLFRLFMELEDQTWYLYLLLAMFNIIYLLNNLEFWGLAALLFDVRQSKRLFAVVSAGDIPAKMVGYLLAVALIPVIGTENLLWVALACLLLSLFIFKPLRKHEAINEFEDTHHVKHGGSKYIYDISIAISGNKLIRHAAMVSFFSFCCLIVVNFVFYGYVKHAFSTDKSLAGFFAIFLAVVRAITMIIKITITNKMADRIGLKASLLITPVLLVLITLIAVIYIPPETTHGNGEKTTFYLFGVLAIVTDVLRSAIQSPVLLATMQPLPAHQRLKGHTIIKGLTDPFAFMSMGILLLIIPLHEGVTDFRLLCYILLGLLSFWILYVNLINNSYLKALSSAIKKKKHNGTQI